MYNNSSEYIKEALRTDANDYSPSLQRMAFADQGILRAEHAAFGLVTEAGEILDVFKKFKFYGKPIDRVNLIEELGDVMWYCAIMADSLGINFVWYTNIAKLKKRFPDKFTSEKALNRDLLAERQVLEERSGDSDERRSP